MKKEDFADLLGGLDEELLRQADELVVQGRAKRGAARQWIRWGAMAACLCLVLCGVTVPTLWSQGRPDAPPVVQDTQRMPSPDVIPTNPSVQETQQLPLLDLSGKQPQRPTETDGGWVVIGDAVTGTQEAAVELEGLWDQDVLNSAAELVQPDFFIRTVIEARVAEVLPDEYLSYGDNKTYRIVKLEVLDAIRGEGLPAEIWYQFPARYAANLLDGYDSLILSVEQIGIENYLLINRTQGRVEYFSDMFATCYVNDPVYGSVIPFKDGVAVGDLWLETPEVYLISECPLEIGNLLERKGFPATHGSTVEEVKANIKAREAEMLWYDSRIPYDYVTADDVFVSDETRTAQAYVAPREGNTFHQMLSIGTDGVKATYIRLINGFGTEERIDVNDSRVGVGKVLYSGNGYTADALSRVPDIGGKIASLDLSELTPPHLAVSDETMALRGVRVSGRYRYVEGRVYGVIRIMWWYDYSDGTSLRGEVMDDCYYLCDDEEFVTYMEREDLETALNDDSVVFHFSYEPHFYAY